MARYRLLIVVLALGAMMLAVPAESEACAFLDRLFGCCGGQTTYAPAVAAAPAPAYVPGCSTCTTQTVSYVPQTYYTTAYRAVPVTTYYRPTSYWNRQTRYFPYTTSRVVYSNPRVVYGYTPSVCCDPCGTSACGVGGCAVGDSGCSTCGVSETYSDPATEAPTIAPNNNGQPQSTYEQETKKAPTTPPTNLKPIPEPSTQLNSTQSAPRLIDPENRTTAKPIRQAAHFKLITQKKAEAIDSGWRGSND